MDRTEFPCPLYSLCLLCQGYVHLCFYGPLVLFVKLYVNSLQTIVGRRRPEKRQEYLNGQLKEVTYGLDYGTIRDTPLSNQLFSLFVFYYTIEYDYL